MTEITRSVEIAADRDSVWSHIRPENWPTIFDFVTEVNGNTNAGSPGLGTQAQVIAGDKDTAITYHIEIIEYKQKERISYRRFGGPLSGKGIIEIQSLHSGTVLRRTSYYDDDLAGETIDALCKSMEGDNLRIKELVEASH
jgi:hypothetical protein